MASFGAKYPHFSKIKTEPDDALPTYEGPVNIGRLVKADPHRKPCLRQALRRRRARRERGRVLVRSVAMETDDMTDDVAAEVYRVYRRGEESPLQGGRLRAAGRSRLLQSPYA